jgi:hypothetical protein
MDSSARLSPSRLRAESGVFLADQDNVLATTL